MAEHRDNTEALPLSEGMKRISLARNSAEKKNAFQEFSKLLIESNQGENFLSLVLARSDSNARRFALEIASRIRPIPELLVPNLIALLGKTKFPTRLRIAVAANIIRQLPVGSPHFQAVFSAIERKTSPVKAAERLSRMAELTPGIEQIKVRRRQLLDQSLTTCPRCSIRFPHAEFVTHLWQAHRLRYDGGRVREPWQVIENWVNSFIRNPRGEVLDRCCELAQFLDPENGINRVHDLLSAGGTLQEQHATMRTLAAEQHASLCPHCFALVPYPLGTEPTPILLAGGVLSGGKLRIEIRDRFIANWLDGDIGEVRLHHGPEPRYALTRRGVVSVIVLPIVGLALLFSVLPPIFGMPPMAPVSLLLFMAIVFYFAIRYHWDYLPTPSDRVVDHAWELVGKRFLNDPIITPADQLIMAGLAEASVNHGDAEHREKTLNLCLERATREELADSLIAALMSLKLEDRDQSQDEVTLLAEQFGKICASRVSWGTANRYFAKNRGDLKNRTRRARLRILMLREAFKSGLEAGDLRKLGRLAPEVGVCYASEDRAGLARLRLLWLYRENRLWQQVGSAASVFDLAQYAQSYLESRPDLLLLQPAPSADESPILICEEGIVFRESILLSTADRLIARHIPGSAGGFEVQINTQKYIFKKNPAPLVRKLEAWRNFLFDDFLPRAVLLENRFSRIGDQLLNRHLRTCDSCMKNFIGLPGETGIFLDGEGDEDEE